MRSACAPARRRAMDPLSESSGTLRSPFERTFYARRDEKEEDVRHIYHCRDIRWHLCRPRVDKPPLMVNNSRRAVKRLFNTSAIAPREERARARGGEGGGEVRGLGVEGVEVCAGESCLQLLRRHRRRRTCISRGYTNYFPDIDRRHGKCCARPWKRT